MKRFFARRKIVCVIEGTKMKRFSTRDISHISVLAKESINALTNVSLENGLVRSRTLVDGTVGCGGHTQKWLEKERTVFPNAKINMHCIDRDASILSKARENIIPPSNTNLLFHHGTYANTLKKFKNVDGILLDLGANSIHFDDASRGFSFSRDGPLDMRFDQTGDVTAADVVNTYSEVQLTSIFKQYGEERYAKEASKAIVRARRKEPFTSTMQLATTLKLVLNHWKANTTTHPATKCFQALRIVVNEELINVQDGIDAGIAAMSSTSRFAIISFHSLEDRIVKRRFKEVVTGLDCYSLFPTRKAIKPTPGEILVNPRARSARLRCIQKRAS